MLSGDSTFLFSVDLEDVRTMIPHGESFAERIPELVDRLLRFLSGHGLHCTFFTVGDIARRYPSLVAEILAEGHEIACHGADHTPLDRHDRASFREDLAVCLEDLARAGANDVRGFRAPMLSLTASTAWAYDVLAEMGFAYSSSVLPARNPLYGWPGFPRSCTQTASGVWELPITLGRTPGLRVPFASGVYFRILPFFVTRRLFAGAARTQPPVVGYCHPYDIDDEQEFFMHPELGGNRLLNWLMYRNRRRVLPRLERLLALQLAVVPYIDFVERRLAAEVGGDRVPHA